MSRYLRFIPFTRSFAMSKAEREHWASESSRLGRALWIVTRKLDTSRTSENCNSSNSTFWLICHYFISEMISHDSRNKIFIVERKSNKAKERRTRKKSEKFFFISEQIEMSKMIYLSFVSSFISWLSGSWTLFRNQKCLKKGLIRRWNTLIYHRILQRHSTNRTTRKTTMTWTRKFFFEWFGEFGFWCNFSHWHLLKNFRLLCKFHGSYLVDKRTNIVALMHRL